MRQNYCNILIIILYLTLFGSCKETSGVCRLLCTGQTCAGDDGAGGCISTSVTSDSCDDSLDETECKDTDSCAARWDEGGSCSASHLTDDLGYDGDGTIFDEQTGLTWTICRSGQIYDGEQCAGDVALLSYCASDDNTCNSGIATGTLQAGASSEVWDACESEQLNSLNWRVPSVEEFNAMSVDIVNYFELPLALLWTTNSVDETNAYAYVFDSSNLDELAQAKTDKNAVICVTD